MSFTRNIFSTSSCFLIWDQEPLTLTRKTNEEKENVENVGQSNQPVSIPKKEKQANKEEMGKFTVENFHSAICRHIRGPKEQFNYGMGGEGSAGGSGQ